MVGVAGWPVGVRQHGHVAQVAGHRGDGFDQGGGPGEPDLLDGALDHQRVGEVVDVLAGAGEVDQLRYPGQAGRAFVGNRGEAALEVVLDGLDVVDRLALDLGELGNVVNAEVQGDRAQAGLLVGPERSNVGDDVVVREMDQPLDLDTHALAVERGLGEVVDQWGDGCAVAAVEGAKGDGRGRVSKRGHGRHPPRVCADH